MARILPASLLPQFQEGSPARDFPFLAHLLGGWFHQDVSYEGDNLEEIVGKYKRVASDHDRQETISDIHRFLAAFGDSDQAVANALEAVFEPEVTLEGWEGLTTKQWLLRVADILSPASS